jgi:hypothetical protein
MLFNKPYKEQTWAGVVPQRRKKMERKDMGKMKTNVMRKKANESATKVAAAFMNRQSRISDYS